jgi:hypothetical protein
LFFHNRYDVKKSLLALILFLTGLEGTAQIIKRPVIIEPKIHAGISLPFYESVYYLIQDEIYAFDISASFPTYGNDFWEKMYKYPRTGLGCSFWSLGNNEVFGKAFSLYGFINIPIFKRKEKYSFNYQVSAGGAYLSEKFDVHNNYLNRAIGSRINIYFRLSIDGKLKLTPRCEMVLEAGTAHFSNGKTSMPNRGINNGSVSLGMNYRFFDNATIVQEPEIPELNRRYVQSVIYSAGSKVYDNLLGKRYFVTSLSYNLEYLLNHRRKIGLGVDFFYDGSISEALASPEGIPEKDFSRLVRFGLHASYTIRYKRLMMGIQGGHYLYSKYTDLTLFYTRLSVQYLITKNVAGSISIKSHYGKADFMDYGIVYYW